MWQKEHKVTTKEVTAKQIWQVWSEIENWPKWDLSLASCSWRVPHAEFKTGAIFNFKPKGGPTIKIFITNATPYRIFDMYAQLFLARLYDYHELRETPEGLEIINITTMRGPLAWLWCKLIGEKVVATIPQQTQNLIALARTK